MARIPLPKSLSLHIDWLAADIKWWLDNKIGRKDLIENCVTKLSNVEPTMTSKTPVTDEIYRAAIEAAGHLGTPVDTTTALRALAYELELRGLNVASPPEATSPGGGDMLTVEGSDGVCVTTGTERTGEIDLGGLLRHHHWIRAHEILFGAESLHIKTIAG